jgi:hypothetical protein
MQHKWMDGQFVQTSYNVRGGVYYDPETGQPAFKTNQQPSLKQVANEKIMQESAIATTAREMRSFHRHRTQVGNSTRTLVYGKHRYRTQADNKQYIWNEAQQEWTYTGYYFEDGELKKEEITEE